MKQISQGDESSNYLVQGFRFYCDVACNYGGCTLSNSTHYHCNACGYAAGQIDDVHSHKSNCPAPNFNSFGRNYDPMYPPPAQSQDCSTFYPMYGLPQTTGPPTISPGAGPYYRTQPTVFSPFYSGFEGYSSQTHDSWPPVQRPPQREMEGRKSCKESRSTPSKVQLPASSSCIFESYADTSEQCFLGPRSGNQQISRTGSAQKQLPSFEPSLGFMMGPEDGMYSPAPFNFHSIASDGYPDNKTSPFAVVDDLPSESCIPFPPIPSHQPPSCLLEPSTCDQDSDLGSDEHEIIVEETGEDQIPNMLKQICAICGEACGWSAIPLREDHPVTLSSQTPVWIKLQQSMGPRVKSRLREGAMMCCKCLHLLNTVDQLQAQLAETSNRLVDRLTNTDEMPEHIHQDIVTLERPEREHSEAGAVIPEPVLQEAEEAPDLTHLHSVCSAHQQPTFKCHFCSKEFSSRRSITSHMRQHICRVKIKCKLVCELCGKQFNHRNNLAEHKPVCSGDFPFHCAICGKGFALQTKLRVHEATHQGKYPMSCGICHKGFLKLSDLNVHKRTHSGEKPFICEICGKSFASVGNYNHHAKLHKQERPFVCTVCNKGFLRRGYLMVHLNRHNGNRPFQCDKCGKSFPDRSNLYHHKRLHEGYKPYTCPICNKALSSGLQAHIRTHTGVRPFSCEKCGQSFTASNSLKKHLKRHKD